MAAFGQPLDPLPCGPFLIIHVLPVPHPWQTIEQRTLAAITNVNVHVEVHIYVCKSLLQKCVCKFLHHVSAAGIHVHLHRASTDASAFVCYQLPY